MISEKESINANLRRSQLEEEKEGQDGDLNEYLENRDKLEEKENYKKPEKKKIPLKYKIAKFFREFKDFLLLLLLLTANISNFSILNAPYTICGLIVLYLLFNHSESISKWKNRIAIILLFYSVLVLILKVVLAFLYFKKKDSIATEFILNNKYTFLNLGFKFINDEDSFIALFNTFQCDGVVLLASILYRIIHYCNEEEKKTNTSQSSFMRKVSFLDYMDSQTYQTYSNIFICSISLITLAITCANTSFMSMFYSLAIHLGLFLWSINKNLVFHKLLYYLLSFLFMVHIIVTHTFNIYDLRKKFLVGSADVKIFKWLGIMKMTTSVEYFLDFLLTVVGNCVCVMAIKMMSRYKEANMFNDSQISGSKDPQDDIHLDLETPPSFWIQAKDTVVKYIFSPYFILHFCRVAAIYWVWRFNNFPTAGLLIWLFYSFMIIKATYMKYITLLVAWPCVIWACYAFMIANIKGLIDDYINDRNRQDLEQYGLEQFDIPLLDFIPVQLTIVLFAILMKINNKAEIEEKLSILKNNKITLDNKMKKKDMTGLKESLLHSGIELQEPSDSPKNDLKVFEIQNKPEVSKNETNSSLSDIIAKLLITNIDKITLVFMYFIAIQKANISHFILTIIFLIQLIIPSLIKKICFLIIISIEVIFSFEFAWDLVKTHIPITENLVDIINLFIDFNSKDLNQDTSEFFLLLILYCFYIQYQNYNSTIYKIYDSDQVSFKNYLENLLKNHKNFKSFVLFVIYTLEEIYIWIILILLFLCICAFGNFITFGVKLILFFIVMYKFLNMSRKYEKGASIIKYIWALVIYCGVNTMLIYFYQFTVLSLLKNWYKGLEDTFPEWLKLNMLVFGLEKYTDDITLKILPHYGSNFLSVLLLWELRRILELRRDLESKRKVVKNEWANVQSEHSQIINNNAETSNSNEKSPIQISYFKYYFYKLLILLCKTYWLFIFLSISAFIVLYQMSVAMVLYIITFSISFILMFRTLINSINKFISKNNKFYLSRLVRYTIVESPKNIHVLKKYRKKTFKYLLISGMSYIVLTYIYTIFDIIQNGDGSSRYPPHPLVSETIEEYVKSIAYIMGVFYNAKSKVHFIFSIWGHILMICLISFDIYIQKLQTILNERIVKIDETIKNNERIERKLFIQKHKKVLDGLKLRKDSFSDSSEVKFSLAAGDDKIHGALEGSFKSALSLKEEDEIRIKTIQTEVKDLELVRVHSNLSNSTSEIYQVPIIRKFLEIFKHFEKNKKEDEMLREHNIIINYNKNTSKRSSITLQITLKKMTEEIIVFFILLSAIIKMDAISLLYILTALFLQFKGKNLYRMYITTICMCFSIILQTILIISNLNIKTDPSGNKIMSEIINNRLGIPWYDNYISESWGFFLNLGVNKYQIDSLWVEFVLVIVCFIYLDNFCYSIYDLEGGTGSNSGINYYALQDKKSVQKALQNITNEEYLEVKANMKLNFETDLMNLEEVKERIILQNYENSDFRDRSRSVNSSKLQDQSLNDFRVSKYSEKYVSNGVLILTQKPVKKGKMQGLILWLKKTLYLTMHNFMLIVTLILSMMNTGLFSAIYIIFSLYYLYTSNNIVLAKPYSFPKAIKSFLRIFLIFDLFLQLSYQAPYNKYLKDYDFILASIGINRTIDYSKPLDASHFDTKSTFLIILKALTYLIISIQVMIYSSKDFLQFYFAFVLKKKDQIYRKSMINAFLFNNKRIQMMGRAVDNRKTIDKVLFELEKQLESWNSKLNMNLNVIGEDSNKIKEEPKEGEEDGNVNKLLSMKSKNENEENSVFVEPELDVSAEVKEILVDKENEESLEKAKILKSKIKEKILNNFLLNFAISIHRKTTNYSFVEKSNKQDLENSIVKGETYIMSIFEKKIDNFLEELDVEGLTIEEWDKIMKSKKDKTKNKQTKKIESSEPDHSKKQQEEEILLLKTKYSEQILTHPLFTKYLTTSYILKHTIGNISKFFIDNFEYICFFIMILNHCIYSSLISIFWPFSVFAFGLIEYPRPKNTFWKKCLRYASVSLVVKFVIQFDFFSNIKIIRDFFYILQTRNIGLNVYKSTWSTEFLGYIIFDAILILALMSQEYILIARGIWDNIESELETVEEANDRIFKAKSISDEDINEYVNNILSKKRAIGVEKKASFINNKMRNSEENFKNYYNDLFPKVRNYKPGEDFYAWYTVAEMIIILFMIFFYTDMDKDNMFKVQGTSTSRQFSGNLVLIAFFHAIKAVIDRVIYAQQSRNNLQFEYVYYHKSTGEKLTQEEIETRNIQINSPKEIDFKYPDLNIIYYQKETTNYPLICKYILQIIIIILSHIFIFFFLPITGNLNLQNSTYCEIKDKDNCNDFSFNPYLQIFYIIYCVYLFFSALQIHYGLMDMRNKSLLMRGDNIIYSSMFKGYKAVPFLYELKLTIDWTCTPTCLDLFKWIKFEAVYDLLFITHCTKLAEIKKPIGQNINIFSKLLMGGTSFLALLALLLGPLLLFSTLNPTNVENNVTGAYVEFSICFQQGERVFNNFTLFKNEYVSSIEDMTTDKWKDYGYSKSSKTKNFPISQVQVITMSSTSDTIWGIAQPHIETIKDRLSEYKTNDFNISLGFTYSFQRPSPPDAKDSVKKFDLTLYNSKKGVDKADHIKTLLDNIKDCKREELLLDNFYNPALRLTSQSHPKVIWDNANFFNVSLALNFICENDPKGIDYTKSYYALRKIDNLDARPGVVFHTFSDKVSKTSTAYDVVTFYISFVIVIGRVIRGVISGEAEKIVLTEMPEPYNLMNLCEGIKISRYRFEFEREEHLYYVLIDFMRSPEILKLLTKSSLKKLQERKEIHQNKLSA